MKLENLMSNNATQKLGKALFFLKIVFFSLVLFSAPVWAEVVRTRWFEVDQTADWEEIEDPTGMALLVLRQRMEPSVSLNVIRVPRAEKSPINQAISSDYSKAGFTNITVKQPVELPDVGIESAAATYATSSDPVGTSRFSVVGRAATLDDSTLWITLTAPPDRVERAVELFRKFLTDMRVVAPEQSPQHAEVESLGAATRSALAVLCILAGVFIARRFVRSVRAQS